MRLIFAGTPVLAARVLLALSRDHEIALVVTRSDAVSGRRGELSASPVASTAQELGLSILKANRLGEEELQRINSAGAELGVVVAYGALFPAAALEHVDWWNVHYSLLPAWRGATPAQHAILHGSGGGITLFKLEQGLDTGPVISSLELPNLAGETAGEYLDRLTEAAIPLVLDALNRRPTPMPQSGRVSLAPKFNREDARLNFSFAASEVEKRILAMNPEPGAWCLAAGNPIKILRAIALGDTDWAALEETPRVAGQVSVKAGRVLVFCGGGTLLELLEVQPAGRNRMTAADWVRGKHNLGSLE